MKRLICLLIVLLLCFSLIMPAFAEEFVGSYDPGDAPDPDDPGGNKPPVDPSSPQTGDVIGTNLMLWVGIMAVSAAALVALLVFRRKNTK